MEHLLCARHCWASSRLIDKEENGLEASWSSQDSSDNRALLRPCVHPCFRPRPRCVYPKGPLCPFCKSGSESGLKSRIRHGEGGAWQREVWPIRTAEMCRLPFAENAVQVFAAHSSFPSEFVSLLITDRFSLLEYTLLCHESLIENRETLDSTCAELIFEDWWSFA